MTHDKSTDLVRRARNLADLHLGIANSFDDHVRGPDAMSQKGHEDTERAITALIAENERLREALEPFAAIADLFDSEVEGHSDTDELSLFYGDGANWLADRFTFAQFRAARAALRKEGEA